MGFFTRLKKGLEKTKKSFISNIEQVIIGYAKIDDDFLDDLEGVMLTGDLGVKTTDYLMREIRRGVKEKIIKDTGDVTPFLEACITTLLTENDEQLPDMDGKLTVILVVGVNGVGKTTTIGKLGMYYQNQGKKVMIAAADTFRAAASEQLTIWADRIGVPIIKHTEGADAAAVVYDAVAAAKARNMDILLIDTAGRLHTKTNLMEELKKISRVAGKLLPGAPHETVLVLDATTGQNAVSQAKLFGAVVPVTSVALTKLDGTAKGGVVISIKQELGVPVRWIGIGEGIDDLRPFDAKEFAAALFDTMDKKELTEQEGSDE